VEVERARYRITVNGIVQGVGFRPFVYRLACSLSLYGNVCNTPSGVCIEVEGAKDRIHRLLKELKTGCPPLARIKEISYEVLPPAGYTEFQIVSSANNGSRKSLIPPDVALCTECAQDITDPSCRFYLYPFTNCTHCGPRFTIVRRIPYDRAQTSMDVFPMCDECTREYEDPSKRRFHAQPVACPRCGPRVRLVDKQGKPVAGDLCEPGTNDSWRRTAWALLGQGRILGVKGIGGFHLCCDAKNPGAVRELRLRKGRDAKPFAVMCRDLSVARRYCLVDATEQQLLSSSAVPIVVLRRHGGDLPGELAPGISTLGVMLPYTPLHKMLLDGPFDTLVMTSGNRGGLPLVKDNRAAFSKLGALADAFIVHDRDIVNRCDDSVVAVVDGQTQFFRRSRGYVPEPILVPGPGSQVMSPVTFGAGGEMKNTFCLLRGEEAFLSQHLGDLDSIEAEMGYREAFHGFLALIGAHPRVIGYDLHPGYQSSRLARQIHGAHIGIQHHHAHMASCLAENGHIRPAIGVILDGTGYGTDGTIWGFEIISGDFLSFRRHYHLSPVPLPGGDRAARACWRTAVSYLVSLLGDEGKQKAFMLYPERKEQTDMLCQMLAKGFNTPHASSCGRLFDAVSSLLGICHENSYEGQAAIELGDIVAYVPPNTESHYGYSVSADQIHATGIFRGILSDLNAGESTQAIALKFHNTVAQMVVDAVKRTAEQTRLSTVALSGGSWQNRYLFRAVKKALKAEGYQVLHHRHVPANDGGIALGQAVICRWQAHAWSRSGS